MILFNLLSKEEASLVKNNIIYHLHGSVIQNGQHTIKGEKNHVAPKEEENIPQNQKKR